MANVGNLFINVTGNTKGLTKALSSAKTKLATFDKQVGRPRGDFMRRASGRFTSAMGERRRFEQGMATMKQMALGHGIASPISEGQEAKMRARMAGKEKGARQAYRQAQRQQTMGGMQLRSRIIVGSVLGVLGITIGALRNTFNAARQQVRDAEQRIGEFEVLGPRGGEIIASRVRMRLAAIKRAQDPRVSDLFLQRQLRSEQAFMTAGQTGALEKEMSFAYAKSASVSAATGALSELNRYSMMFPIIAQYQLMYGAAKSIAGSLKTLRTGPVGTTGNTGGP